MFYQGAKLLGFIGPPFFFSHFGKFVAYLYPAPSSFPMTSFFLHPQQSTHSLLRPYSRTRLDSLPQVRCMLLTSITSQRELEITGTSVVSMHAHSFAKTNTRHEFKDYIHWNFNQYHIERELEVVFCEHEGMLGF